MTHVRPRMPRSSRAALLALGITACCGAAATTPKLFDAAPPPDWVNELSLSVPDKPAPHPHGQDFLVLDKQINIASAEAFYRRAYQIVSESGRQNGAQIQVDFDPSYQTLTLHRVRLWRAGASIDRLDPARVEVIQQERDLDRQLYNGLRTATIILEDVRVGDVIDLAYTLRGWNPVFGDKYIDAVQLGWGVPVRYQRYLAHLPEGRFLTTKHHGVPNGTLTAIKQDQALEWTMRDQSVIESEGRVPASEVVYPFLELSEFQTWGDVVKWALPLYTPPERPGPRLAEVLREIAARGATANDRALDALDFVQREIRYLGIEMGPGSHQPTDPEEVLRRRFGDCKDKALLLTAILRQLGFKAAPALVHSSNRELTGQRLPSPYAFDHVIVALELGQLSVMLDPTLAYQRGAALLGRHTGRYGPFLRVAEDNLAATELTPSRQSSGDLMRTISRETFSMSSLHEPAALSVVTSAEGAAAMALRAYFAENTREQIGRSYLEYYTPYYPGITQTAPVQYHDDAAENRVILIESYRVSNVFVRNGDSPVLRAEFNPIGIWNEIRATNVAQRKWPLAVSHPVLLEQKISLHLPHDWQIKPTSMQVRDAAFDFQADVTAVSSRQLELQYRWESRSAAVPVARLAEYAANLQNARAQLGYTLTWNPSIGEGGYPLNWPMVVLAMVLLLSGASLSWWLISHRNPSPSGQEPPSLATDSVATDAYSRQHRTEKLVGLGGWLILVGLGLVVRPIMLLGNLVGAHQAYFHHGTWQAVTTPGHDGYNPHYAIGAPLELSLTLVLLVYCVLLIAMFFRRSWLFPRSIQVFFVTNVAVTLLLAWNNSQLGQTDSATISATAQQIIQTVGAAAVWIPYFQVSRRVRLTFVN